ncbi:pyridoxal phosphate-dependent transferase [Lactarius pseudohatsudake]|nr:pyridoxal phosphate-dependent transferase [Lactarius pseudohatsudake]
MESKPRIHPSTSPVSVVKWLPRLGSFFPLKNGHDTVTLRPLPVPSSLRDSHDAVCAWFLGPKAENVDYFMMSVETILNDVIQCRRNFAPEDKVCISLIDNWRRFYPGSLDGFHRRRSSLLTRVQEELLPQHCVPFYSPRYMAHMVTDVSMPATLGYPSKYKSQQGRPTAWGHITCGGSVANFESMCDTLLTADVPQYTRVARNLKFHSLALRRAAENEPSLAHVAAHFRIRLCTGKEKLFAECDTWELLNLAPDEAVSLTTRISETFGLSTPALQAVLDNYFIQTMGKDDLEKHLGIEQPPQYLCRRTTHYSWAKGTGSTNITRVPVDEQARIDCQALDTLLTECVKHHRGVYAIVVNMGTTEHGSVDALSEILALRRKYQQQGSSFLIHANAAWGGYFTSMLVPNPDLTGSESALCYQDGRLRYMVTWNSPVIGFEDESSKMGVYGIEGSKPGAAPVAAWLGHEVTGLHSGGFGYLLGQSVFTSTKFKQRIGPSGQEDLFVLVNVSMSPFAVNFVPVLADAFCQAAEEEVNISVERNRFVPASARRAFILQGSDPINLVHMPYFGAASQRQQCILNGELSGVGFKAYTEAKRADPTATYVACTLRGEDLSTIVKRKSLKCTISKLTAEGQIEKISVLKYRPLSSRYLDPTYPSKMPFYLCGTAREMHIDHVKSELLPVEGDRSAFVAGLKGGLIAVADAIPEFLMQPLSANSLKSFFHPGAKVAVSIHHDRNAARPQGPGLCDQLGDPITHGTITLADNTFTDAYMINVGTSTVVPQSAEDEPHNP